MRRSNGIVPSLICVLCITGKLLQCLTGTPVPYSVPREKEEGHPIYFTLPQSGKLCGWLQQASSQPQLRLRPRSLLIGLE